MKSRACDAKNACNCVVECEENDDESALTKRRIAESIRQRESEFISKILLVFLLLGGVCLVAAWGSEYYWESVFHRMYETGGLADKTTKVADIQDYQTLKPLVNLTMYAIPKTLDFIGMGFLLMSVLILAVNSACNVWRSYQQRRKFKRTGQ